MTNVTMAHRARLSLSRGITITPAIPSEEPFPVPLLVVSMARVNISVRA